MALVTAAHPHPKAKFRKKSEFKIFAKWDSKKGGPSKKILIFVKFSTLSSIFDF